MVEPEKRRAARIIAVDSQGRVLLLQYARSNGERFWATPGGGLESNESFEEAALREASEEMGVQGLAIKFLWERMTHFVHLDRVIHQQEQFFLMRVEPEHMRGPVETFHEKEGILEIRWWSLAALDGTDEIVFPEELASKLRAAILSG